jgi:GTP cyclohydrolase IA
MVTQKDAEEAVKILIEWIGDSPQRHGLLSTPTKVVKSYQDIFSGYNTKIETILAGPLNKELAQEELLIFNNIPFLSFCEHHMLPFSGYITIGYIPTKGTIGFDRISQVVDMFSRRLQLQERMTKEIADALFKHLQSEGIAVSVVAHHLCMSLIGSRKNKVDVYSEAMRGVFLTNKELQQKFIHLTKLKDIYEK